MNSNNNEKLNNIFVQSAGVSAGNPFSSKTEPFAIIKDTGMPKRINGYDSAMLNQTAFDNGEEENLSLEYRIKEKESVLKDLDEKIKISDNYGTTNESFGLKAKRQRILQELSTLRKQQLYGTGKSVKQTMREKMPALYKFNRFVSRYILARISKKIRSVVTISDSLEQLSDISKSVDELIDMNVPYGEKIQNYEKLTRYLYQANTIHSQISKTLRK